MPPDLYFACFLQANASLPTAYELRYGTSAINWTVRITRNFRGGLDPAPPSVTTALSNAVARLARELNWQGTARHFELNWKSLAITQRRYVIYELIKFKIQLDLCPFAKTTSRHGRVTKNTNTAGQVKGFRRRMSLNG